MFKATLGNSSLTPEHLKEAERTIIHFIQKASLKLGSKTVSKHSPLYHLDPYMEDGREMAEMADQSWTCWT